MGSGQQATRTRFGSGRCARYAGEPARAAVTHAVKSERQDMLALLLDLGLDPDERERVAGLEDVVHSWGEPLRQCAILGQHGHGGTSAEGRSERQHQRLRRQLGDVRGLRPGRSAMVELLERHGGFVDAGPAGYLGLTERLKRLFDDEAAGRLQEGIVPPGRRRRRGAALSAPLPAATSSSSRWRSSTWSGREGTRAGSGGSCNRSGIIRRLKASVT